MVALSMAAAARCALGEAYQIDGIRHPADFIKIVHTPHQTALDIAPRAEVFDMQIAPALRKFTGRLQRTFSPRLRGFCKTAIVRSLTVAFR